MVKNIPIQDALPSTIEKSGYIITDKIAHDRKADLYRGQLKKTGEPVIIKQFHNRPNNYYSLALHKYEYDVLSNFHKKGALSPIDYDDDNSLIIFEDFNGVLLSNYLCQADFDLESAIRISLGIANALMDLQAGELIHKQICPKNILLNPENFEVKLINFGNASRVLREIPETREVHLDIEMLAYTSPEQTGRTNRLIDFRTDFYSFGATLYEVFTGEPPFTTIDPLEMIHCHIAKQPITPKLVNKELPTVICDIILKLLSKSPEERYRTAFSVLSDIAKCLRQHLGGNPIATFKIAENDVSDQLHIPEKIFGRDKETKQLLDALTFTLSSKKILYLISGYSGIGKTALVKQVYPDITEAKGFFFAAKYQRYNKNKPYSAMVEIFSELVAYLQNEDEEQLHNWRTLINNALGDDGQVMIDVIPDLQLIIGAQPPVEELGPTGHEKRFNAVFMRFINVFCRPHSPLILFLDDLQWADTASIRLIKLLILDDNINDLMIIGAYRSNEVDPSHELMLARKNLEDQGLPVQSVELPPLPESCVQEITAATLFSQPDQVESLAHLITEKTDGNPFFIQEFLTNLHKEKLLAFEKETGMWKWNVNEINTQGVTDNVLDIMSVKLGRLNEASRHVTQLSACIGQRFDLRTLYYIAPKNTSNQALVDALDDCINQRIIIPMDQSYKLAKSQIDSESFDPPIQYSFCHDRIHEAAYRIGSELERRDIHHKIGQCYLQLFDEKELQDRVFETVNQLNLSIELINEAHSKRQLVELNLSACRGALNNSAFQTGLTYIKIALSLLAENSWVKDYKLALDVHVEAAKAAYVNGEMDLVYKITEVIHQNAVELLDKLRADDVVMQAHIAVSDYSKATDIALKALEQLGITFPADPTTEDNLIAIEEPLKRLGTKSISSLMELPALTDPYQKMAQHILSSVAGAIYVTKPNLFTLSSVTRCLITMDHGMSEESSFSFSSYGIILSVAANKPKEAYEFGKLALYALSQYPGSDFKAKVLNGMYIFVAHRTEHIRNSLDTLLESYRAGFDAGDYEIAFYAIKTHFAHSFLCGQNATHLAEHFNSLRAGVSKMENEFAIPMVDSYYQTVQTIKEGLERPHRAEEIEYQAKEIVPLFSKSTFSVGLFHIYFQNMFVALIYDQHDAAYNWAKKARCHKKGVIGGSILVTFMAYDAWLILRKLKTLNEDQQADEMAVFDVNYRYIEQHANDAPMNYRHRFEFVQAEQARHAGNVEVALRYFEQAVNLAKQNDFVHEFAFFAEQTAEYYMELGLVRGAKSFITSAKYGYQEWGCDPKHKELVRRFPNEVTLEAAADYDEGTITDTYIDMETLNKSLKAIAAENVHSRLLELTLQTALQFAGAQRGLLLFCKDGDYHIDAEISVTDDSSEILQSEPLVDSLRISNAVVEQTLSTGKTLVIQDASKTDKTLPNLKTDPYISKYEIKSILCIPVISGFNQEEHIDGLLYLENNLAANTFTADRVGILEIVALSAAGRLELSRKAVTDGLTQLYNNEYFYVNLRKHFALAKRTPNMLSLIMIDIDHFKKFNDTWGHQIGDKVLREVASTVKNATRESDVVARYGGEEFAIIAPNTKLPGAAILAERVRAAVEALAVKNGEKDTLSVTISLGVATTLEGVGSHEELVRLADESLYKAKAAGRNCIITTE